MKTIKVRDFMTSPVATAVLDSDVGRIRDLMNLKNCSAIPIVEIKGENILIRGIVTKNDIVGVFDDTVKVSQIMKRSTYVVDSDYTAQEAAKLMLQHKTHHLLVLEEGNLIGMLSSLDFVRLSASEEI